MLRPFRNEWTTVFVNSGREALDIMAKEPFDVIVSDMRMPGMDGAQLLIEVRARAPQTVRIVLSGYTDQQMFLKSVGTAHQYLSKPCDAETLRSTVQRAFGLRELLSDIALKRLVSQMTSLPSTPALYYELTKVLQDENTSVKKVGEIVAKDMGMAAKVLQLVNSAFFGVRRHISNPVEAVSYLGLDTIKALAFSTKVFSQFDQIRTGTFSIQKLWEHSMNIGAIAQRIAKAEHASDKVIDDTLMAGLLHDVGTLVLAANLPFKFSAMLKEAEVQKIKHWDAERAHFGATHAEVGAYLMWLWGLPDPIVEAIAYHHAPAKCPAQTFSPLTAVHVANALEEERQGANKNDGGDRLDMRHLERIGMTDRIAKWRKIFQEAA